jgi:hypothetical protein
MYIQVIVYLPRIFYAEKNEVEIRGLNEFSKITKNNR